MISIQPGSFLHREFFLNETGDETKAKSTVNNVSFVYE